MARRYTKGVAASKGYRRARRAALRLHAKGARQNVHDTRVWAKRVVEHHQLIAVEDFKPKILAMSTMAARARMLRQVQPGQNGSNVARGRCRTVVSVPPGWTTMTC
jgi:putative transposase